MGDDLTPALQAVPADIVALADYQRHAAARLDAHALAYIDGGAADEITQRANRSAWDALWLQPRVLRHVGDGHTRVELLGRTLAHPILLAPVAFQQIAHADGELASAHAAAAQGAGVIVSAQASVSLERIAEAVRHEADRGPLWFQLYMPHDRGFARELLRRIEAAGYEAVVLTVDAPSHGARDRMRRAGGAWPAHVRAVNLAAQPPAARTRGGASLFAQLQAAPTWDDIGWLRDATSLPLLVKGVLHPADALEAAARGAAGIIVSNHGGRTLDTALPTAHALPRIAQSLAALPGAIAPALLVDGGIRRGTDVLKACALGARAVLLGRPYVHALATCGALGVAHALRLLRDELEIAMALCGCRDLANIDAELVIGAVHARPALKVAPPADRSDDAFD